MRPGATTRTIIAFARSQHLAETWKPRGLRDGGPNLKLIIEPDDGAAPLVSAIKKAKKSVETTIFRFDRADVEAAMKAAVSRGVRVTTLIASVNRGGERSLRELEMRFLDAGIIVARSADDLVRYHNKMLIIDRRILYVLSFNFTHLDMDYSRGFGIVTRNARLLQEAIKLLIADCTRNPYTAGLNTFVVSPVNSRKTLSDFLKRAKKQLLIYDPKITDKQMIRILQERAKADVEIRIIGRMDQRGDLPVVKLNRKLRLHARTIIRDRHQAFIGSQGLRAAELDARREVGIIVRDPKIVRQLIETFESDWTSASAKNQDPAKDKKDPAKAEEVQEETPREVPKQEVEKAVKVLVQELEPLTATVKGAVKKVIAETGGDVMEDKMVQYTVKKVVKKAAKDAVKEALENSKKH